MSDGQLRASDGFISQETEDLVRALPNWMPKDPTSGNFSLLVPAGRALERAETDIESIGRETTLQYASELGSIELIAEPLGTSQKTNDSVEKYRLRAISEFQAITNESTVDDILKRISSLLDVNVEKLGYEEQHGFSIVYVPSRAIENLTISVEDFSTVVETLTVAGYTIDVQVIGTLDFVTPDQYQTGDYNSEFGYGTLDENGDPVENGGTYSAIIS